MTKKKAGRPPVIDDVVLGKLEAAFSYGATDKEACFYAGINPDTLYEYCKQHPAFTERKENLKDQPILLARQTVVKALNNPAQAQWYLSRKRKQEFAERTETDITTQGEAIVPTHDIMALAAEVSAKLKERKTK